MRCAAILPIVLWLASLAFVAPGWAQGPMTPQEKVTVIHAATLIDGVSDHARHNVLIVIRGNKIESVAEGGNPPAGAPVIDFPASATVLPGLIDAHTHICIQGEEPEEGGYDARCKRGGQDRVRQRRRRLQMD